MKLLHQRDTMTAEERLQAVVNLQVPDRVPVAPYLEFFACRYAGMTQHDLFFNIRKADLAMRKTIEDLGMIDATYSPYTGTGPLVLGMFPVPPKLPGVGDMPADSLWQFEETSAMGPEEYPEMEKGALRWLVKTLFQMNPHMRDPRRLLGFLGYFTISPLEKRYSVKSWRKRGVETLMSSGFSGPPLEFFSLGLRSFNDFIFDLYRCPEDVKKASLKFRKTLNFIALSSSLSCGVKRVLVGGARTSASSLSPKLFEEMAWPEWEDMCTYLIRHDVTPILHLDCDWIPFLHYFRELPRGKCILALDGATDIFQAKEILGDHMCIMGDVPAALLKLGEPEGVEAYCERLIREVGADGGFILSSGCTVPVDAKPENVKAMIGSATKYGYYA